MKSIEMTGKTAEEAIKAGLAELGKESSDVTIDILDYGSPGLFGMFGRLAKVRLTVKEEDPELSFEMPVFSLDAQPQKKAGKPEKKAKKEPREAKPKAEKQKEERPAEPVQPAADAADEPVAEPAAETAQPRKEEKPARPEKKKESRGERANRREKKPEKKAPQKPIEPMIPSPTEDLPETDPETLSERGRVAYDFLRELTELMNVPVEIRVQEEEGRIRLQMLGDTMGVLIGRRGDTLDALQYLTSLQVNKGQDEYIRVMLDTEHYRARREEALRKLADRMANRVRKTGHRVALEPMNPYERRVLHSALQSNPYVTTHSEGEEPYRRVIITPQ